VEAAILLTLDNCTDTFREERRDPPGSPYFHCTHILPDAGRHLAVRYIVNDSGAPSGVLQVVYADYDSYTPP
jgi:hypothetical protein